MEKVEGAYDVVILKQKINEIIGYLNSQAQPEENEPEKVYVEPIVPNFTEELSAPVEYKTRKQVKEMFKDTPEEWEEVNKDIWYMVGGKKYVSINGEKYVRTSDLEQLLDKAREEGKREAFTKDEWFMLKLAMNDIFNKGNGAYDEISRKIDRLSKLNKEE